MNIQQNPIGQMVNTPSAISIRNLRHAYRGKPSIQSMNLELPAGRFVGLLGENGCGKTTLLKILAGLINEYQGDVELFGSKPGETTKSFVSFLPDTSFLNPNWTGFSAIQYFTDFFADFRQDKAMQMLDFLQLSPKLKISAMSKGMREKMQLALTMARDAKIYLLDEPISGIDPAAREMTLQTIINNYSPDSLVIMSTHLINDLEPVIDHAVFMRHGKVLLSGDVDALRSQYNTSLNQIFIREYSYVY